MKYRGILIGVCLSSCCIAAEPWRGETDAATKLLAEKQFQQCAQKLEAVLPAIDQPKDKAFALSNLAACYWSMFQAEKDPKAKATLMEKHIGYLESIVGLDNCEDETIKVAAATKLAEILRNTGKSDQAIAALSRAMVAPPTLSPDSQIRLLLMRGTLEFNRGYAREAEATYRKAAELTAKDITLVADARNQIAAIYIQSMGKYEEALKALDYPAENPVMGTKVSDQVLGTRLYYCGQAKRNLQRQEEAKADLENSLPLCKSTPALLGRSKLALGTLLLEMKQPEAGLQTLEEVINLKGAAPLDTSLAAVSRARSFAAMGKPQEAQKEYERILTLPRANRDHVAEAKRKLGREAK